MATTNVLLREDVDNLGVRGEIVKVKAGYARNYLLPRKLAVEATAGNVKQIEGERKALLKREAHDRATAEGQAEQLRSLSLTFERKVGEHGVLYGSVTSMDIAEALRAQGYEVDRRRIQLREPITSGTASSSGLMCSTGSSRLPSSTARSISARQFGDATEAGLITKQNESLAAMPARRSSFQLDAGGMSSRSTQVSLPCSSSAAESRSTNSRLSARA